MSAAPSRPERRGAPIAGAIAEGADGSREPAAIPLDDPCLDRLSEAIGAAGGLGIETAPAKAVLADARARLGFPTEGAVIALVGGTGVGKSSLLNALAGAEVSVASARRPTTASAVAWVPAGSAGALDPVLDWLGVAPTDRRAEPGDAGPPVAILDLPDLDSIEREHRRRVDALLPRVDAVIWVTDPEKYHDAVLHDEVLTRWIPRLGRQLVVVNKADRLRPEDAERLRRDLAADVAAIGGRASGRRSEVETVLASTVDPGGIDGIRRWLDDTARTKAVVRGRLVASIRATVDALAAAAGVTADEPTPVLDAARRLAATDDATRALLRVVDLPEVRRQAAAATRARARARGAGPLGGLTSRLFRWSGREARVADPAGFLARWPDRGTTAMAASAVRGAFADPIRTAPPAVRRLLAEQAATGPLESGLRRAVDRAIGRDPGDPPSSRWWTVLGLAQTATTVALVLAAAWVALWILVRFPVDSAVLPAVGRVPMPFVALAAVIVLGYAIARVLGAHAGAVGGRWAAALADRIRDAVRAEVAATAFAGTDEIDARRAALASARRATRSGCR